VARTPTNSNPGNISDESGGPSRRRRRPGRSNLRDRDKSGSSNHLAEFSTTATEHVADDNRYANSNVDEANRSINDADIQINKRVEPGKIAQQSAKSIKEPAKIQTQEQNTKREWCMFLPPTLRAESRKMHAAVRIQEGKRVGLSLAAAGDDSPKLCRLYVTDRRTGIKYLIDTGSDVSVYPPQKHHMFRGKAEPYQLYAANGSVIPTYGTKTLQPDLSLRREFPWRFNIADVLQPIIEADFLAHYHLLPDMKKKKLIDGETGLTAQGIIAAHYG